MKQITYISLTLFLFMSSVSYGQLTLGRQVLGSTGGFATGTNISVSSTVGEAVVQTLFSANLILTQGFQQTLKQNDSIVDMEVINESCPGAGNGSIFINNVLGCPGPYTVTIKSVDDTTMQLGQDTLATGDYEVIIFGSNGCVYPLIVFVGLDSDEDCMLKFYTGITPNDDGKNDVWIIDNIEMFPENSVKIFNRWGNLVWSGDNYDNNEVLWEGESNIGVEMGDATYFYVAEVGGKIYKGWVELTR
jgi:gliding motility-associated-like protein